MEIVCIIHIQALLQFIQQCNFGVDDRYAEPNVTVLFNLLKGLNATYGLFLVSYMLQFASMY